MHNIFKKKSKHQNQRLSNKSNNSSLNNNSLHNSHTNGSNGQSVNGQHTAATKRMTSHSPPPSAVAMSRSSTHSPLNPSLNKSAINLTNGLLVNPNSSSPQVVTTVAPTTSSSSMATPSHSSSSALSSGHTGQTSFTNVEYLLTNPLYTNPMPDIPPPLPPKQKQKLRKSCAPVMQSSISLPAGVISTSSSAQAMGQNPLIANSSKFQNNPSLRTQQSVPAPGQHHKPLERTIANTFSSAGSSSSTGSDISSHQIVPTVPHNSSSVADKSVNSNKVAESQSGGHESDDCSPPPTPPIRQRMSRPNNLASIETSFVGKPSTSGVLAVMAPLATPDHDLPNILLVADPCEHSLSDASDGDDSAANSRQRLVDSYEDEDMDEGDDNEEVPPSFVSESEVIFN